MRKATFLPQLSSVWTLRVSPNAWIKIYSREPLHNHYANRYVKSPVTRGHCKGYAFVERRVAQRLTDFDVSMREKVDRRQQRNWNSWAKIARRPRHRRRRLRHRLHFRRRYFRAVYRRQNDSVAFPDYVSVFAILDTHTRACARVRTFLAGICNAKLAGTNGSLIMHSARR